MTKSNRYLSKIAYIALILLFCSCTVKSTPDKVLVKAELLMEAYPDSALVLLNQIDPTTIKDEANYAWYALLFTQAKYKNFITLEDDSLINIAVNFFKSKRNILTTKAFFYQGCTYMDMQKTKEAVDAYLKALKVMPKNADNKLLSMVYENIGSCYEKQSLYGTAIDMYRESYRAGVRGNDSVAIFYALRNIAGIYMLQEKTDSALIFYNKALDISKRRCDSLQLSMIYSDMVHPYCQRKEYDQAYFYITRAKAFSIDQEDDMINSYLKGKTLVGLQQPESALECFNQSKYSSDIHTKAASYYSLYKIEESLKKYPEAIQYADSFLLLYDSIQSMAQRAEIDQLSDNYYLELEKAKKREQIGYIIAVSITLFGAVICFFLWRERRKGKKYINIQNELMLKRAATLQQDSSDENVAKTQPQTAMELTTQKFELSKQLFQATEAYQMLQRIERISNDSTKYTQQERTQLCDSIYVFFADTMSDLRKYNKNLTYIDMLYCLLFLLKISKESIMYLTSTSFNALKMRKSRLKTKLSPEIFKWIFDSE